MSRQAHLYERPDLGVRYFVVAVENLIGSNSIILDGDGNPENFWPEMEAFIKQHMATHDGQAPTDEQIATHILSRIRDV